MHQLPFELRLLIVEKLDAPDILHLQLTCQKMYTEIERSGKTIWRRCLQRQCFENLLFLPSYRHLSTASELKNACTGTRRFVKMLEAAYATGGTLPHTRTTLEFPSGLFKASDLRDTLLIPGGRFLLTFEDNWACIWDLHSLAEDGVSSPALLVRHYLDTPIDYVVAIDMFNEVKIRLLLKVIAADTTPPDVQIHRILDSYQVLEATYLDSGTFSIRTMGQISVDGFPSMDFNVMLDDNVLFRFDDLTMIWDFQNNQVSGWRVRGIPSIRDIFPNHDHVFYINGEGVHGVKPFPFQPVHGNCVRLSSFSKSSSATSFSVFHEFPHILCSADSVIGPVFCNSELETGRSLIYELREETAYTLKFYRYRFQFNPADPLASSLTLLQSSSQSFQENKLSPHKLAPRSHQACEGRLVTVWSEDTRFVEDDDQLTGSIFLSLSSPSVNASKPNDPASSSSGTTPKRSVVGEVKLVPFIVDPKNSLPVRSIEDLVCDFCSAAGRAVVLWQTDSSHLVTSHSLD